MITKKPTLLFTFTLLLHLGILPHYLDELEAYGQRPSHDISEKIPPSVKITKPTYCSDALMTGYITIGGTASDKESGIEKVEAFLHPLPFNNEFPFQQVEPVSPGNWSQWSFVTFVPDDDKTYRILVRATDKSGNVNWDETLLNSETIRGIHKARIALDNGSQGQNTSRIALVTPTFTSAAYNYDSFYFFYYKYASINEGVAITSDLNLMTGQLPLESEDAAIIETFASWIRKSSPESIVSIIKDENVHHGLIFTEDGGNVYDVLFMFHNEYVTQEEYDNLRKFVSNGGNMVFMDANIFYAEVKYDEVSCMVTLVKGHNWEFDGEAVRKGVWERYLEENKEWMGSNFINRDISNPVRFDNNPFNYTHFEENELVNPNAKVLIDYGAQFKVESAKNPFVIGGLLTPDEYDDLGIRVATYELEYGRGKVIMLGIYGQNLVNENSFRNFFEKIVLTRTLGIKHVLNVDGETFELYSKVQDGEVTDIRLDSVSKSLSLTLDMKENSSSGEKILAITMPKKLIDAANNDNAMAGFTVLVDGNAVQYSQSYDDIERGITIFIPANAKIVEILGTYVAPEIDARLMIMALALIISVTLRISPKSYRRFSKK